MMPPSCQVCESREICPVWAKQRKELTRLRGAGWFGDKPFQNIVLSFGVELGRFCSVFSLDLKKAL